MTFLWILALTALTNAHADSIQGVVRAGLSAKAALPTGTTLYVIVRTKNDSKGPPAAVIKIPNPKFPQNFQLGPKNLIRVGIPFEGPFEIRAKLSLHGDPRSRSGDYLSPKLDGVKPGSQNVILELSEIKP